MEDQMQADAVEQALGGSKPRKQRKTPLVLVITEERNWGDFYHLNAGVALAEPQNPDGLRFVSSYAGNYNGIRIANLRATSQGDDDSRPEGRLYAWSFGYDRRSIKVEELEDVESEIKSIKVIQKRMAGYRERFGPPATYPQYLGYFANAIGATQFAFRSKYEAFRFTDVKGGIWGAQNLINNWKEEKR